jgi:hypothetical protein
MKNNLMELYPARARSDPGLAAGVRGDPQMITVMRIDPPEQLGSRGDPPEVRHTRNGPPADSARGKPTEVQKLRKAPRAESRISRYSGETLLSKFISFPQKLKCNKRKANNFSQGKNMSEWVRLMPQLM